jgi:hypothetical protein
MKRTPMKRSSPLRSKPKAWTKPERAPVLVVPAVKPKPRAVMALCVGAGVAQPKDGEFRSEAWRRAVASLPCAWCLKDGPSQCAHANHRGKGMGLKAPDAWTFPLCPEHHREFDQGKLLTKDRRREMADEWVILTIRALAQKGLVRA